MPSDDAPINPETRQEPRVDLPGVGGPSRSRWRAASAGPARGAADRVRRSHAQTRVTLRVALAFVAAAALGWAIADAAWLPLHLFLAGGVVLAISGVSLMLTVTWSAAPAPSDRLVAVQRMCIAAGAAGVAVGRQLDLPAGVVAAAGAAYLVGIALLAVLLVTTARRGVERRFDPAVAAYVAALVAGVGGVAVGIDMAVAAPSPHLRDAHVTANLLGLVGLVVAGTLPYFAATVGRSRMAAHATPRRLAVLVGWQAVAVASAICGLVSDVDVVAAAAFGAYACGIAGALWFTPTPTRRQLRWAGPRLVALWAGAAWWVAAVVAAAEVVGRDGRPLNGSWLWVLVVAGYGQILWGSIAYLLPVLRGGGHERLGDGFAATRSWVGLAAANVAGFAFVLSATPVAAAAVGVWLVDAAMRAARVGFGSRASTAREGEQT